MYNAFHSTTNMYMLYIPFQNKYAIHSTTNTDKCRRLTDLLPLLQCCILSKEDVSDIIENLTVFLTYIRFFFFFTICHCISCARIKILLLLLTLFTCACSPMAASTLMTTPGFGSGSFNLGINTYRQDTCNNSRLIMGLWCDATKNSVGRYQ